MMNPKNDNNNNNNNDDDDLSDHTIAMRKSFFFCKNSFVSLLNNNNNNNNNNETTIYHYLRWGDDDDDASVRKRAMDKKKAMLTIMLTKEQRKQHEEEENNSNDNDSLVYNSNNNYSNNNSNYLNNNRTIAIIDDLSEITPYDFRTRFTRQNRPCLIRKVGQYFEYVTNEWVSTSSTCSSSSATKSNECNSNIQPNKSNSSDASTINRTWFQNVLGNDALVPVRYHELSSSSSSSSLLLDKDGRATECSTKMMKVSAWMELLDDDANNTPANNGSVEKKSVSTTHYLKDWHFQLCFEKQQQQQQQQHQHQQQQQQQQHIKTRLNDDNTDERSIIIPTTTELYSVPPHFQHDLLNHFFLNFYDSDNSADYRFVYWGPAQSTTTIHSDVLNSFSWSYNVHGTKQWTFYYKNDSSSRIDDKDQKNNDNCCHLGGDGDSVGVVQIIQKSGELMFVPSQVQHSVINLEETISINHNWITTANIQAVYDCMVTEIKAIDIELNQWQQDLNESWDAKENMLRGCIGLDITALLFMILTRLLEILHSSFHPSEKHHTPASDVDYDDNTKNDFHKDDAKIMAESELYYDAVRLLDMIRILRNHDGLFLENRLAATLCSSDMALHTIDILKQSEELWLSSSLLMTE